MKIKSQLILFLIENSDDLAMIIIASILCYLIVGGNVVLYLFSLFSAYAAYFFLKIVLLKIGKRLQMLVDFDYLKNKRN